MTLHYAIEGEWLLADGQGYELRPVCGNDFDGRKRLTEDPAQVTCRKCLTLSGFDVPSALAALEGQIEPARMVMTERARIGRAA